MGRTIIQPIGPLYGEAVNGTVFGRPNGSIYVPDTNSITAIAPIDPCYVRNVSGQNGTYVCNASGTRGDTIAVSARAQDNAAYIRGDFSDDPDFATFASRIYTAGKFNENVSRMITTADYTIVNGTTYYYRVVLVASTDVPVAYSDTIELTGWSSE